MLFLILQKKIFFLLEMRKPWGTPRLCSVFGRELDRVEMRCCPLQRDVAVLDEGLNRFDAFGTVRGSSIGDGAHEGTRGPFDSVPGAGVHAVTLALVPIEVGAGVDRRVGGGGAGVVAAGVGRVDGPTGTLGVADRTVALDGGLRDADRLAVVGLLLELALGAVRGVAVVTVGNADVVIATGTASGVGGGGISASLENRPEQGGEDEDAPSHGVPPFAQARQSRGVGTNRTIFTLPVLFAFVKRNFPQLFWYLAKIGLF